MKRQTVLYVRPKNLQSLEGFGLQFEAQRQRRRNFDHPGDKCQLRCNLETEDQKETESLENEFDRDFRRAIPAYWSRRRVG